MKALILAAGQGRRLWPFTTDCPKCLLSIGSRTILEQQLHYLEWAGIDEAVLVCGFGAKCIDRQLESYAGALHIKTLYNPFYAISDNLISLWVARSEMEGPLMLLNGDGVFHPKIFQRLLRSDTTSCLMVDRKQTYDSDDMKVHLCDGRIVRIGKSLPPETVDAASIGLMKFSAAAVESLRDTLEEIISDGTAMNSYFLDGIQRLVDRGFAVDTCAVDGLPWADVDTPEDLHHVRQHALNFQLDAPLAQDSPLYRAAKGNA
jgi:choline kinase